MKALLLLSISFFSFNIITAQNSGSISGTLMDTIARQPVGDATVSVVDARDSSLVTFGRASKTGLFELKYLAPGNYRLLISHVSYAALSRNFTINANETNVKLGYIVMLPRSLMLGAVTVVSEAPPVTIKNDTIEFNAGSFKTRPNAVVEDLLKKLPGVQVDKDGKIKANGEEVKKVLVDGKQFFGNDPKIASKNLPADIVDKVQVFDKKSDQSQFTGFDDGNSEKTINLSLKSDKKNGLFGKLAAGAGNKERYQGSFNLNSFNKERQISALGMANNTNKQGFTFMDYFNFGGGFNGGGGRGGKLEITDTGLPLEGMSNTNNGIATTWAGGLNFNDSWNKKLEINGSYFYNRLENLSDQRVNREYLVPGNQFTQQQNSQLKKKNENHRLNFSADYKIDSFNSVKLNSSFSHQSSAAMSQNNYTSTSSLGKIMNSGYSANLNDGNANGWTNSLLFRHRFPKKGRTLSLNLNMSLSDSRANGSLESLNRFFDETGNEREADTINQVNTQNSSSSTYGANLSYTEPLSRKSLLEFTYAYNLNKNNSDKETYDVGIGKDSVLNQFLTNRFDNRYDYHRLGVNWRYQVAKWNLTLGTLFQQSDQDNRFHFPTRDSALSQSFKNLLPLARLQYNFNKYKNLRLNYTTNTRAPSGSQLNPIPDNSDPLNVVLGNPDLGQEFIHRLQLNFLSFDPFRQTSLFTMLNLQAKKNAIVNSDFIDEKGVRLTRPVNANGIYNIDLSLSWGFPVKKIKSNINLNTGVNQSKNVNFLNGDQNNINYWNISQEANLNFVNKKTVDLTVAFRISYNSVHYSLSPSQNTKYWNQEYTLDANIYLPWSLTLGNEFSFTRNTGYADGFNTNVALWNVGLAKQFLKNKRGEIKLQVFDLLNDNAGIARNVNQNYVEDVYSRVLNRYFLVSFTYNISRFAGKAVPVMQERSNIKIIGPR